MFEHTPRSGETLHEPAHQASNAERENREPCCEGHGGCCCGGGSYVDREAGNGEHEETCHGAQPADGKNQMKRETEVAQGSTLFRAFLFRYA